MLLCMMLWAGRWWAVCGGILGQLLGLAGLGGRTGSWLRWAMITVLLCGNTSDAYMIYN